MPPASPALLLMCGPSGDEGTTLGGAVALGAALGWAVSATTAEGVVAASADGVAFGAEEGLAAVQEAQLSSETNNRLKQRMVRIMADNARLV